MLDSILLKYGCNPNQKPASISIEGKLPVKVLNGKAGYINFLDALNGYQLVKELKEATNLPSATSFKHVSPAGAAVGLPLTQEEKKMYFVKEDAALSPLAIAYIRARGADRMSSFGDFIALSDICDEDTAKVINKEVSDGVIAPGYSDKALEILKAKRKGTYAIIEIDPEYIPNPIETKTVYGITFTQAHNDFAVTEETFSNIVSKNKAITEEAKRDLTVALIALKYTQSNSVVYAQNGQTIGVGAGQQSRIHCTRLAGSKADLWHLRQAERVLNLPFKKELTRNEKDNVIEQYLSEEPETDLFTAWQNNFTTPVAPFTREEKKAYLASIKGVSLASDAFFPFRDNIERAYKSGVSYVTEPGGSLRDDLVIEAADEHSMVLFFTSSRLFHH
ncbi:MAG: phosphoribosylaminoimidazolecarboxamide formyltransferase [Spirochaetales bacterium]|nr:phosphoribosylaminoimidazolecarboxamide formyltransferase [Spirochaetales bacterium]